MDLDDGAVRVRSFMPRDPNGLNAVALVKLLNLAASIADRNVPRLAAVLYAGKSVKEALE